MQGIWEEFLNIIKEEAGSRVVETWFRAVSLHQWDPFNKTVYLQAPNSFVKDWIKSNYTDMIQQHLKRLLHADSLKIIFLDIRSQQTEQEKETSKIITTAIVPATLDGAKHHALTQATHKKSTGYINSSFIFETFVVGPSNSLAYAAAQAVTEKPGFVYNPLFIYGESGLGKTHLLHAIGNQIKKNNQQASVLYQTADRFVNEFINAIRFDKVHKFQAKYQHIDVLLIDDIQFISNKEQTQEAFFHIFNTLYEASKQIVFSSDTYPQDMHGIAERLRSRLASGLIADIHVPSLETKIAILKRKAEHSNEVLHDDVALFIASRAVTNIRELEGCLIRVLAFASLTKQPVTLDLAKRVLMRGTEQVINNQGIDLDRIMKAVGNHFQYSLHDLKSKSRSKDLSFVRQVAMFLMKRMTDKSLRDIGAYLGGRDHSTVVHAIEKVEEHLQQFPEFEHELKRIELTVKSAQL
jgi:chromosomal replication initiator protein